MNGSRAPDLQRVLRFLTDEDFDARIVRALMSRVGELDILSVRDVGLSAAEDPRVLDWAASNGRALLTHDVNTMLGHADRRVRDGLHHAGVVKVPQNLDFGRAIEDLLLIIAVATATDLRDQILHLPL